MKKLILVVAAIAITAGAFAQANSTNTKTSPKNLNNTQKQTVPNNPQDLNNTQKQNSPQDLNNNQNQNSQNNSRDLNSNPNQNLQNNPQGINNQNQNMQNQPFDKLHPDGVMMQNGQLMLVKDGKITNFDEDLTLANGTRITKDGSYVRKEGSKLTINEGQHMDMTGNIVSIKPCNDKNNNYSQNMQNNQMGQSHPDGFMFQNGKVVQVRNGKTTILDQDLTLANGTKIMKDGSYVKKDGTRTTLKEGQHLDVSGNLIPMKSNNDKDMKGNHDDMKGNHDNHMKGTNDKDLKGTNDKNMKGTNDKNMYLVPDSTKNKNK